MLLPIRHLVLKKEEAALLKPSSVFKVKAVANTFFLISHGKTWYRIKGGIDNLTVGETLVVHKDMLVPEHQPLYT